MRPETEPALDQPSGDGAATSRLPEPAEVRPGFRHVPRLGWVPDDWDIQTIRSLAAKQRNALVGGPFGSDLVSSDYVEAGVPVIRGQNMGSPWIGGRFVYVSGEKAKRLSSNTARPFDLVVTQRGTLGQVSLVPQGASDIYVVSQSQMKITLDTNICDPHFIYHIMSYETLQKYIAGETIQTGVPHINLGILGGIRIPIPPLAEQQRIARILRASDQTLAHLDALIASKERRAAGLAQRLLTGETRLPEFEDQPWTKVQIGSLLKSVKRPVKWNDESLYRLVSLRRGSAGLFFREPLYGHQIKTKTLMTARAGDFLISKMQVVHGATGFVTPDFDGAHISGSYIILAPRDERKIDLSFFARLSKMPFMYHLAYLASYGVHIEKMTFNPKFYFKSEIEVPQTAEEQRAIVVVLDAAAAEIASLRQQRAALARQKKGLMQRLLTGEVRVPTVTLPS